MDKVFIRELEEADAKTSWKWRNNKSVWQHTKTRPDRLITYEIELEWLQNVLKRDNEKRFAICESVTGKYIGNVQLTNINNYEAAFHIYIGDTDCWGKGYGTEATLLMVKYGLDILKLQSIWLDVKKKNIAAIRTYEKAGFLHLFDYDDYHRMSIHKLDSVAKKVSVFVMTYNHAEFISEALDGIVNQRVNFDFEIVLGDDFSKDNTREKLMDYAFQYPELFKFLFYPKNMSAAVNQQWVLKNCTGKYIALCEGDDYWTDPLKLQKQVDFLETNDDYAICFHNARILKYNDPDDTSFSNGLNQKETSTFDDLAKGEYIYTPTCVFRRQDFEKFPAIHGKYLNNYTIDLHNAQFGKIKYLNEVMAVYRIHPGGIWSMVPRLKTLINQLPTYEFYINYFEKKYRHLFVTHVRSITKEIITIKVETNDLTEFWKYYLKYVWYHLRSKSEYKQMISVLRYVIKEKLKHLAGRFNLNLKTN